MATSIDIAEDTIPCTGMPKTSFAKSEAFMEAQSDVFETSEGIFTVEV